MIKNILSLFDGISCGQVALKQLGLSFLNYYASEIDKYAIQITQKNFPDTIQLGDVRNIKAKDLPKIDLLIGGSPCTGFSFAGKQLNFNDKQSILFFEYLRLLDECKPKYFLLENVKMKKEYQDIISDFLNVNPIEINSSLFSAQDRKRLYWTNIPVDDITSSNTETVEDILEEEVDDKYFIEPQKAITICDNEWKKRKIAFMGADSQGNRIYNIHNKAVTLCGNSGGLGAKTGLYVFPCITPERLNKRQNGRRFKPPKSKFYTLTAQDKHGVLIDNYIRKLTPTECEKLQTLPIGYTDGISDNQRYKCIGNGWTVEVIKHILKNIK